LRQCVDGLASRPRVVPARDRREWGVLWQHARLETACRDRESRRKIRRIDRRRLARSATRDSGGEAPRVGFETGIAAFLAEYRRLLFSGRRRSYLRRRKAEPRSTVSRMECGRGKLPIAIRQKRSDRAELQRTDPCPLRRQIRYGLKA